MIRDLAERARDLARELYDDAVDWCEGRSPWARAPLTLYLAYAGIRHLADPMYRSWFGGITLVFHEMGHILFSPFGRTMMLLGGSVMQLFVPFAAALYLLLRQRDWFGVAVGQSWLAFSAWELATYVGDANKEELPLVSLGGQPEHDWSTLLTEWHLLNSCDLFAAVIRVLAFLTWGTSVAGSSLLLWKMRSTAKKSGR